MKVIAAAAAAVVSLCMSICTAACGQQPATARDTAEPTSSAAAATRSTAAARPRIVFLGDSLTAGYGLDLDQSVPSLIQARLAADGYDYEVVK